MLKKLKATGNGFFKWEIMLRVGKRTVHKTFEDSPAHATQIYADLLAEKNRDTMGLSPSRIVEAVTLKHACHEYEKEMQRLKYSQSHISHTIRSLNLLKTVAGENAWLGEVGREMLLKWRAARIEIPYGQQKKLAGARTVNKDFDQLSGFLTYCFKQRAWLEDNPAYGVPRLKEKAPPVRFVEWENYEKFANAAWVYRPAMALVIEVASESGCRIMEAVNAKVEDVDAKRKQWSKIVKRGRRIIVPAGEWVLKAAEGRDSKSPLCPREDGEHWRYNAVEWAFGPICIAAGIVKITPHHLRHARAVWDLEADMPIRTVQMKLGHTTVTTTERYLKMATRRGQPELRRDPSQYVTELKTVFANVTKADTKK